MALPLLAVAALASGCGGSAKTSSATTSLPAAGTRSGAAGRAKFTNCLEAHGVPPSQATQGFGFRRSSGSTTPSGATGPPSTSAAFAAAFQACRADLPRFGFGGLQNSAAGRAYLQCLQLHGVTLPSTPPTGAGGATTGTTPGSGFRSLTSNPAYQAARSACAALAPARGPRPDGGSTTSSSTAAG